MKAVFFFIYFTLKLKKMNNNLDFISILSTILQAEQQHKNELVEKLDYILTNNEIKKPEKHNRKDDLTTSYYKIEISKKELEEIIEVISYSISESFDKNHEPTQSTYVLENLLDLWSQISPDCADL